MSYTPESYDEFRAGGVSGDGTTPPPEAGVRSALDFLIEQFQYRVSSIERYFNDYNRGSPLKIDLICPSLVDYDWPLAKGEPTKSRLQDQVDLHQKFAVLSGGRVHCFAPFDPFREVVFRRTGESWSSLEFVQNAIRNQGAIGVKLYPPMGFAALGNEDLDVWRGKSWLPDIAQEGDFGAGLDNAMRSLFSWCVEEDVPILAHTNASNTPHDDFLPMIGPEHWAKALNEFKGLRVNFGHFGGAGSADFAQDNVHQFLQLMADANSGNNTFADGSYFARLLEEPDEIRDRLKSMLNSMQFGAIARSRLVYGSDWKMLLVEKKAENYLLSFREVFSDLSEGSDQLTNAFFGGNAANFLGLENGAETRARLERFYVGHDVSPPVWMNKVDG